MGVRNIDINNIWSSIILFYDGILTVNNIIFNMESYFSTFGST